MKKKVIFIPLLVTLLSIFFVIGKTIIFKDYVMFDKESTWSPCEQNKVCYQRIVLHSNLNLVLSGVINKRTTVSKQNLKDFIKTLKSTDIFNQKCEGRPLPDYSAKYLIKYGSSKIEIQYPGCNEQLKQIEKSIYPQLFN